MIAHQRMAHIGKQSAGKVLQIDGRGAKKSRSAISALESVGAGHRASDGGLNALVVENSQAPRA